MQAGQVEDAMKTIFLHCGFHKTGSTSLQALLRANRPALQGRLGILVQGDKALRGLERSCRSFDRHPGPVNSKAIAEAWHAILAIVSQGPDVWIISTEDVLGRIPSSRDRADIYANAPQILRLVCAFSPQVDIRVCAYLRQPSDWVDSIHRHLVRTRGLAARAEDFRTLRKFSAAPDPLEDAKRRIEAVLTLPIYRFTLEGESKERLGPGTGLLRLAGLTEAEIATLALVPRQNEGLDRATLDHLSKPAMLWLPAFIRRMVIKRILRKKPTQS